MWYFFLSLFQGFYAVYREVFKKLSAEDYEFLDDKESDFEYPGFGTSQSDYDEVNRNTGCCISHILTPSSPPCLPEREKEGEKGERERQRKTGREREREKEV